MILNNLIYKNKKDVYNKLSSIKLLKIVKTYLEKKGIISINVKDVFDVISNRQIRNFFYGNINLDEPLSFNFIECNAAKTLLIIEANSNFNLLKTDTILSAISERIKENEVVIGFYQDNSMNDDQAKILLINTIYDPVSDFSLDVFNEQLDKKYDIEKIVNYCKINNDYTVSNIQKIANVGFFECCKIKEYILNIYKENRNLQLKGYKISDNEFIVFEEICDDLKLLLESKYGLPNYYFFNIKHEYGVYNYNGKIISFIDKNITVDSLNRIKNKMNSYSNSGYKTPIHRDPYTYEGKTSR